MCDVRGPIDGHQRRLYRGIVDALTKFDIPAGDILIVLDDHRRW